MSQSEYKAMFELLTMLVLDWRTGVLIVLLVSAAIVDYQTHRIPNWLVLSGILFGVAYNIAFPPFLHAGLLWPLEGLGVGFIAFLPLYLLGAMGAGDVKLMSMVGAIIGPSGMFGVLLYTMIAGGALSILLVLARGTAVRLFDNLNNLFFVGYFSALSSAKPDLHIDASRSAGKLPYGVAIAIGTIAYLVSHQLGFQ